MEVNSCKIVGFRKNRLKVKVGHAEEIKNTANRGADPWQRKRFLDLPVPGLVSPCSEGSSLLTLWVSDCSCSVHSKLWSSTAWSPPARLKKRRETCSGSST